MCRPAGAVYVGVVATATTYMPVRVPAENRIVKFCLLWDHQLENSLEIESYDFGSGILYGNYR
jgi:hypothetical protein